MAFTSAFGTRFAAPILALASFPILCGLAALPARAEPAPPPPARTGEVDVRVEGLRSAKGLIRACLTRNPRYFPKCEDDPVARRTSIPAVTGAHFSFGALAPGDYALLILHDENSNARVDKTLGIPREGVGFSRNPRLFMGPPSFDSVRFPVAQVPVTQVIHMKYFL